MPVLFAKASLQQYEWFLSQAEVDEVSVYIPIASVLQGGVDFISVLKAVPEAELYR